MKLKKKQVFFWGGGQFAQNTNFCTVLIQDSWSECYHPYKKKALLPQED